MSPSKQPRRLRVYAFDPSTGRNFSNVATRTVTISLPSELDPGDGPRFGPSGEYVEVVDHDPASGVFYPPLDLNSDTVRFNDGLPPSPENPQFHQQMVYAVVMNTIAVFEEALGRVVLWAPETRRQSGRWEEFMTRRLRIYPHALREANAFYDPGKKALLFGYFRAPETSKGAPPGTTVFTCLSHDIVVHETVHAILDGLHPSYAENSGPDTRALHEAFADVIALFQLFSFPEVLEDQIAKTRGDLEKQSLLGQLAQEFGKTLGRGHALRDFLGSEKDGEWQLREPDPMALRKAHGPHARGAILVAAIFRAFLTIYKHRVSDLFRIASNGSGILRSGEIDPDLKKRLSYEAAQCARRVTRICIRAMDYMPPVTVSFGDYLRAIITADHDLFPEDTQSYRDALIEAYESWGIVPSNMPVISERALIWPTLKEAEENREATAPHPEGPVDFDKIRGHLGMFMSYPDHVLDELRFNSDQITADQLKSRVKLIEQAQNDIGTANELVAAALHEFDTARKGSAAPKEAAKAFHILQSNVLEIGASMDRETEYYVARYYKRVLWFLLTAKRTERFADLIGISFRQDAPATVLRSSNTERPSLHVHSVRIAKRMGQRGQLEREYVVELIQSRRGYFDPDKQAREDARKLPAKPSSLSKRKHDFIYRAGATFLIDAKSFEVRRLIRTAHDICDDQGLAAQRAHLTGEISRPRNAFFSGLSTGGAAAFTDLHRHTHDDTEGFA